LLRCRRSLINAPLAGGASRLAAFLLPQILPVFSVVAPCQPGAALRDLVLVQRGQATSRISKWGSNKEIQSETDKGILSVDGGDNSDNGVCRPGRSTATSTLQGDVPRAGRPSR